jgi:hypothetical protein
VCSMLAPLRSIRNGTASMRKPETPSCSQKPMIFWISARTYGFQVLKIGLMIVEAMEVCTAPPCDRTSRCSSAVPEHDALLVILGTLVGPDVPVAIGRRAARARGLEPGAVDRGVIDDQIDDHAPGRALRRSS